MPGVTNKPLMESVVMLNVINLSVVTPLVLLTNIVQGWKFLQQNLLAYNKIKINKQSFLDEKCIPFTKSRTIKGLRATSYQKTVYKNMFLNFN